MEVAAQDDEGRSACRRHLLFQSGDPRKPTAAVDGQCLIDVVDLEDRELRASDERVRLLRGGYGGRDQRDKEHQRRKSAAQHDA